jgi:hypothetical protein
MKHHGRAAEQRQRTLVLWPLAAAVLTGVVALGIGRVLSAAAEGSAAPGPGQATQVRRFQPWAENGLASDVSLASVTSGHCWSGSILDPGRADAWRCITAGSVIHDPCFSNAFPNTADVLACAEGPFEGNLVLLTLTEPLPLVLANQGDDGAAPWALQLVGGAYCTAQGGTTWVVEGMRLNYLCDDGRWVAGRPDRSAPLWVVRYTTDRATTVPVAVAIAWY